MKNKLLSAGILGIGLVVSSLILTNGAFAQTAEDSIQFPVAELGGCGDKDACKVYCDDADHIDACLAFAEKNNLMSEDELATAKKFMEAGGKGPGDCTGKESCEAYCNDINHINACIAFAEKAGILSPKELAEAKQVQAAIAKGVKPPACNGKKECDAYCEDSSHMKECIAFGEAAGFLQGKELEDAKKVLVAVENGATPPACKGKEACDAYCSDRTHIEACMTFAQAAGLMTPEEAQNSQKMLDAIKKGVLPPNCSGKEGCDTYCAEPAHTDECINFSIAAGFMTEKEAEMARKTGGKGPGGCVGKDACDTFCGNQDNQQTCMDFAKENGFDEGSGGPGGGQQGQINEQLQPWKDMCSDNTELACADDAGKFVADAKIGADKQPVCPTGSTAKCGNYPQIRQKGQNKQNQNQQGQSGNKFQPGSGVVNPGGQQMPQQTGPGGCKGPEECKAYCQSHQEECQKFVPQGGAGGQMGPADQQQQQNQQQGGQYGPGNYPNQGPPPGDGTSGMYQQQQQSQQMPPPEMGGGGGGITPGEPIPQAQPIEQAPPPIEQTAPQSSNFDLNSSLAAVITAFREFVF